MKLQKTILSIGLPEAVRLLHISDTHLLLADGRDGLRQRELADQRIRYHLDALLKPLPSVEKERERVVRAFEELLDYGRTHCDRIVHTGDFYDFQTASNVEALKKILRQWMLFYAPGSHEFLQRLYDLPETEAFQRAATLPFVEDAAGRPLDFGVLWVKGVRLVSLDNSDYRFRDAQFRALREELAVRTAPTVLLMHTPLYTPALYRELTEARGKKWADLAGVPREDECGKPLMAPVERYADETTLQMCEFIRHQAQIRLLLAGHLHFFWQGDFGSGQTQLLAGLGYDGEASEICLE